MPEPTISELAIALDSDLLLLIAAAAVFGLMVGWMIGHLLNYKQVGRLSHELETERKINSERHQALEQTFTTLSVEALRHNNQTFLELAQQTLSRFQVQARGELELKEQAMESLVKPIHTALQRTEAQLQRLERDRREAYGALHKHLETLTRTQEALHDETRNLVQALRRPEVRGQWGELTLRRLAELAGMVEHCDFVEQVHTATEDGSLRPDMVVHMPAGREIVLDVKTPLDAYLSAVEASDDRSRQHLLTQHARKIRERVRELASKRYWNQFTRAPDFVILFIPGDQFLSAALDVDRGLLENALNQRVILATPTSLVALLRAVAYGWRQEALTRNAEEIRCVGEDLYQRLTTLAEHLARLGRSLDTSVTQYNRLVGSFESKVLPGSRKFVDLGISNDQAVAEPSKIQRTARELNAPDASS